MNKKKKVFLTQQQREEVLTLIQAKDSSYNEIATTYNVVPSVISSIARNNGIFCRFSRKTKKPTTPIIEAPPILLSSNLSLLEQLEESYQIIEEKVQEWTKIKNNAFKQLDIYRKKQSELYIALQALKRANWANNNKEEK